MGDNDTIKKTLLVASCLCIVCSVLVSGAAVWLRPLQIENRQLDIKKKLLLTTGLISDSSAKKEEIERAFANVEVWIIDLATGEKASHIDPENFIEKKAAKDAQLGKAIDPSKDLAKIKRRSRYAKVYLVKKDGHLDQIVLPIKGKGLWSTLYGFMALEADAKTVRGFGYYEHGETPGLGGEVDNPLWKSQWQGKVVYDQNFNPIIDVVKGKVLPGNPQAKYQVDGLSGATITSYGVEMMLKYWLGEDGFAPFLAKIRRTRE